MSRYTSNTAYKKIVGSGGPGKTSLRVYEFLYANGPSTGQEINQALGSNSAHKRLSELRSKGVVDEMDTKVCSVTGRNSTAWDTTSASVVLGPPAKPKRSVKVELQVWEQADGSESIELVVGGKVYDNVSMHMAAGINKSTFKHNGKHTVEIRGWSGMPDYTTDPKELNA